MTFARILKSLKNKLELNVLHSEPSGVPTRKEFTIPRDNTALYIGWRNLI